MQAPALYALVVSLAVSGSAAIRDVPKGYCHNCEVTCFEDCTLKYDREIIQPDLTNTKRHSRADTRVEAHMKKKLYGVVSLGQSSIEDGPEALKQSFVSCLQKDQCSCPREAAAKKKKKLSMLAQGSGKKRCAVAVEDPCAMGCASKAWEVPAFLQQSQSIKPGPSDPEDAAIPWSINVHPVKINSFATGRQNLERCMKSCLAATCGCEDAPGMEAIDDLMSAIKANDAAKDPVQDTTPMWQYRHATIDECGKGMHGKKITKGLYADLAGGPDGWSEVCSTEFFEAMGKAPDVEQKNCKNAKAYLAGCSWDTTRNQCVWGLKKMIPCYTRFTDDNKL